MCVKLLHGNDITDDMLNQIAAVDQACYDGTQLQKLVHVFTSASTKGQTGQLLVAYDEATQVVVGYVELCGCEDAYYQSFIEGNGTTEIIAPSPNDLTAIEKETKHLLLNSFAILPSYQNGELVQELTRGLIEIINSCIQAGNCPISDVIMTANSQDGRKLARNLLFRELYKDTAGTTAYICDTCLFEKLLRNELYFQSYAADAWLLLPLAEHEANLRVSNLLDADTSGISLCRNEEDAQVGKQIIDVLQEYIRYECDNVVSQSLEMLSLGSFEFLATTDLYELTEDGKEIVRANVKAHAVLVGHRATNMYILALMFPKYPFSVTQLQDQLSYRYIKIKCSSISEYGDPQCEFAGLHEALNDSEYIDIYEYLRLRFGLHECGDGKSLLLLSDKPETLEELEDMLVAEAYDNFGREYKLKSKTVRESATENKAQFENHELYLSKKAIVYVGSEFYGDTLERIDEIGDYLFIVILTLFQNTALAKVNKRVVRILETNSDISPRAKLEIDLEYGKTVRFWENRNFKYLSTQLESEVVQQAFSNTDLKQVYEEHQEYLEHIVSSKNAIAENRNGMVINVVATILALIETQEFFIGLIEKFYTSLGVDAVYAEATTSLGIPGILILILLVVWINKRRRSHMIKRKL